MRKISIIIIIIHLLLSSFVHAQLVDNKYAISLGYSVGNFQGTETINEGNYISPSLFSNYHTFSGFSVKGLINSKGYLSYGINYDCQFANEWMSLNYTDFENSKIVLQTITPLVRFHNKFREKGISNRVQLYLETGISAGIAALTLSHALFDIRTKDNNEAASPMNDESIFFGLKGAVGLEYSPVQDVGLFVNYSYQLDRISSKFYNDKTPTTSFINVGLVLKFTKNKQLF